MSERALELAEAAAREAGQLALEGFRAGTEIRLKGEIDLLTEYDLRCEKLIRERIAEVFPQHAIVGEELERTTSAADDVWYIDPIDGTTNFAHGHPFFCVSISLWGSEGPAVGVVYAPALDVCWKAARGFGAWRNDVRCEVSSRSELGSSLCATGFPYDRRTNPDNNVLEMSMFLREVRGIRRCGSAAIDLSLVADGTYDLYWERQLNPWDMCAGALLVLEAGGRLSDYDGSAADPRSGRLVASNGKVHDAALAVLERARQERASP